MREDLHLQVLELYLCAAFLVALGLWCAHRWLSPHARHRQHAESAATFLLGLEVGAYGACRRASLPSSVAPGARR